jgi:hypothetical protein
MRFLVYFIGSLAFYYYLFGYDIFIFECLCVGINIFRFVKIYFCSYLAHMKIKVQRIHWFSTMKLDGGIDDGVQPL